MNDGNSTSGDCITNGNIPYVQTELSTGKCDAMIYPMKQNESIQLILRGQTKVVAKSAYDNRDQEVYHCGTNKDDWWINQYRLKQMNSSDVGKIYNNRTSQLYDVYGYSYSGEYNTTSLGNIYSLSGYGENIQLDIRAQEDMYLVIFNLGARISNTIMETTDQLFTWASNVTINMVYALVDGVYEYVIPRVSIIIGKYLVNLLSYYLWSNINDYIQNNAVSGQIEYNQAVNRAQPIITEVEDALIPIQN